MIEVWDRIRAVIRAIPKGTVMSYSEVGEAAGFVRAARQVAWVLKTSSESHQLPWHRVVRKDRRIGIRDPWGHQLQRELLELEGWRVDESGRLQRAESPSS